MKNSNEIRVNINSIYLPKQASFAKRIAAFVIDLIFFLVLTTGFAFAISAIYGMEKYGNQIKDAYVTHEVYVEDNENGNIEYNGKKYVLCDNIETLSKEEIDARHMACGKDINFQSASRMRNYGYIVIFTVAPFIAFLIYDFIVPQFLKHGRTLGAYLFGIGYVTDEDVDVKPKNIFVRFLFGRFIIDVIIPFAGVTYILLPTGFGIVGIVLIVGVVLGNIGALCFTKDKRAIHDIVARIKPIDNSCQIYFKTTSELSAARAKEAREMETTKRD